VIVDQETMLERRAEEYGLDLLGEAFLFSDELDGSEPWRPMMVTHYFGRLRSRVGLDHLTFQSLRRFMDTYGQDLGFSPAQVALRAGHNPAVAGSFYTGTLPKPTASWPMPSPSWCRSQKCWIDVGFQAEPAGTPVPRLSVSPAQALRPRQDSNLRPSH